MERESKPDNVGDSQEVVGEVLQFDEVNHGLSVDNVDKPSDRSNDHGEESVATGNAAQIHELANENDNVERRFPKLEDASELVNDSQNELQESTPKQPESVTENSDNTSSGEGSSGVSSPAKTFNPRKARKRGIFVSYAPHANFFEKRFISYTIKELRNIGFCDDIWFDKDDGVPVESPFCFQQRLEIAEKCRAALLFLSESYFNSRVCRHEGRILLGRGRNKGDGESADIDCIEKPVRLFCVKYCHGQLPFEYRSLEEGVLDLSSNPTSNVAELSSEVVGTFSEELEKYAPLFGLRIPSPPMEVESLKLNRQKQLSSWSFSEVQAWLSALKMHAHCSISFEENDIDGYLLLSLTETDMEMNLNVDSRVARRKLVQQIKRLQEDQCHVKENWYLKCLKCKVKEDALYVICDPNDARLCHSLRAELASRNFQVFKHERLGQSKEEFLQLNSGHLASSNHVVILLSTTAATSLFVYNEVMFADWLGKSLVVAMVANSWDKLRPNMQAILGGCPAVDFESRPLAESMDILLYHLKPFRNMPAVILEQEFLDRMVEGLKPLKVLAVMAKNGHDTEESLPRPKVFLSYHWDVQTKVQLLVQYLESHGFQCWTDVSNVSKRHSSSHEHNHENVHTQIQRYIKTATAVVCCVTPKYICSENCTKDLSVAESMNKPVLPVLLQWVAWPPEGTRVRRALANSYCIDMSNDNLFKKNLHTLDTHLKKILAKRSSREAHGAVDFANTAKSQEPVRVKS